MPNLCEEITKLRQTKAEEEAKSISQRKAEFIKAIKPSILVQFDKDEIVIQYPVDTPPMSLIRAALRDEGFGDVDFYEKHLVVYTKRLTVRDWVSELAKSEGHFYVKF